MYPEIFFAMRGINPVKFLYLNNIWVPIIGCVPIEDNVSDEKDNIKEDQGKNEELDNEKQAGFLFEQFDNIESKEKRIETAVPIDKDIYTIGGYFSLPVILSQTTDFYDRGSATISGFNIVTPFRLEKLKNKNLKLHLISKATLMHKAKDKYTGWVELGISLRYDINSSKIIRNRGLIKRRQTIIE